MFSIEKDLLHKILDKKFRSIVGNLCERVEKEKLDKKVTKSIIFEIKKESWESMREIEDQISAFSKGVDISVTLRKPSSL